MKKVQILLSGIIIMAIGAGVLAFKAKKIGGYCLYRTTIHFSEGNHETICRTLGQFTLTNFPNGIVLRSVYTTWSICSDLPSTTSSDFCNNIYTVSIEE